MPERSSAKIDCAPLEADVKALAGQAQAAQAVDERVRNGSRPQEIAVGEANVGVAKARAEEAAEALRRAQALQLGISVTQAVMLQVERDARISERAARGCARPPRSLAFRLARGRHRRSRCAT